MSSITVSTTAALLAAAKVAQPGETIFLAPGTYSAVDFNNVHVNGTLNITSSNPNNPAVITSLEVNSSSGLTFSNLTMSTIGAKTPYPFSIGSSSNIAFTGIQVIGNPAVNQSAFDFGNSTNVSVTNSHFQGVENAIGDLNNNGVLISGNTFTGLTGDGVDNAGSSNVVITGNTFTDFQPSGQEHPDAIQFWTTNTTSSASNITISDNTISQGAGQPNQGIFISDQVGTLPYQNVTITDNTVVGGMWNGITAAHVNGLNISGNTVVGLEGGNTARIVLALDTGVTLTANQAQQIILNGQDASQVAQSGNGLTTAVTTSNMQTLNSNIGAVAANAQTSAVNTVLTGTTPQTLILTGAANLSAVANSGGDHIIGNAGNDILTSGTGADTFTEGAGTDSFVFGQNSGADVITNFGANGAHDTINISAYLAAGDHPTVKAVGANTVITMDAHDSITLLGVQPSSVIATGIGFTH